MTNYRLFGVELSPYSVKLRSYLRYKGIAHQWIVRTAAQQAEFQKYAKLPLVPLLVADDGASFQDSTPIIERLERENPSPSIVPSGEVMPFVAALLEEYADEWGNKHMFHYRWAYAPDRKSAARRIAVLNLPPGIMSRLPFVRGMMRNKIADMISTRMIPRLSFVGSSETTAPQIEASFERLCTYLQAHLSSRKYIFGGRPSLADFGLWGQIYNAWTDPTPKAIIREKYSGLEAWIKRMLSPRDEGGWEDWPALAPTLEPILENEVAALFLPWSDANANALAAGQKTFGVELMGKAFSQETQKYHARSLAAIRARYKESQNSALDQVLAKTGCLDWLAA